MIRVFSVHLFRREGSRGLLGQPVPGEIESESTENVPADSQEASPCEGVETGEESTEPGLAPVGAGAAQPKVPVEGPAADKGAPEESVHE